MFKAYIARGANNNFFDKFLSILVGVIVGVITTAINKAIFTEKFIKFVNDHIANFEITMKSSYIITFIHYNTYFFIGLISFMFIWAVATRDKRRLNLISQIIDIAILEIEAKQNKKENSSTN
ncbi:hypothetical protein CEW92_03820 [Bacillaceae bacterium SAS-127]|nr:hypothetical protein CEW92_03820 [Bacillaceae bacterium SAS-127]